MQTHTLVSEEQSNLDSPCLFRLSIYFYTLSFPHTFDNNQVSNNNKIRENKSDRTKLHKTNIQGKEKCQRKKSTKHRDTIPQLTVNKYTSRSTYTILRHILKGLYLLQRYSHNCIHCLPIQNRHWKQLG